MFEFDIPVLMEAHRKKRPETQKESAKRLILSVYWQTEGSQSPAVEKTKRKKESKKKKLRKRVQIPMGVGEKEGKKNKDESGEQRILPLSI